MSLPPIRPLTAEDRGPIVIVTAYACIVETILFTIIKLVSNKALKRKTDWDDGLLCIAVLLALAQSIITERSAINGVGRYEASLTQSQLEHYFKVCRHARLLGSMLTLAACLHFKYPVSDSAGTCKIISAHPDSSSERITYNPAGTSNKSWHNLSMAYFQHIRSLFPVQPSAVMVLRPISMCWSRCNVVSCSYL